MTTTYHLERRDDAFLLGDAPVHEPDVAHRTPTELVRRWNQINSECRRVNGPRAFVPLRAFAVENGRVRKLNAAEKAEVLV